ncbi:MAG: hypothetical protein QOE48_1943, partial [Mycobacterium sp.]|nr:hypothetical protein [Mycobacterium sp.]
PEVWEPRLHLQAVLGPSGHLFNLAALDERSRAIRVRDRPQESPPRISSRE